MPSENLFPTTQWLLVVQAKEASEEERRTALETLCRLYWQPVFWLARRLGRSDHDAEDLAQGFFADLLSRDFLAMVSQERGRFRTFLRAAATKYFFKQWRRETSQKRGGVPAERFISLDAVEESPANQEDPKLDVLFDREWARSLLSTALKRVRAEYEATGKAALFDALECRLSPGVSSLSVTELATELKMSEGAVKTATFRLRKRFGEVLRSEVGRTVHTKEEAEDELRHLLAALLSE